MNPEKLAALVDRFPTPAARDGKLAEVDKAATDAALAELTAGGKDAVTGLVGMLAPADKGGDGKARHALHALATHVAGLGDDGQRKAVAEALASTLDGDRPAEVKAFVIRQVQLIGGKEVTPALGKLLADDALREPAAQALLAIRTGAADEFRRALPKATGKARLTVVHALGTLRDPTAAAEVRKLLNDADRDTRLTAAWAVANAGDAGSADGLLKLADRAEGYERSKATQACFLLAERLAATDQAAAAGIYTKLHQTRIDPDEAHVRAAAARGLGMK